MPSVDFSEVEVEVGVEVEGEVEVEVGVEVEGDACVVEADTLEVVPVTD